MKRHKSSKRGLTFWVKIASIVVAVVAVLEFLSHRGGSPANKGVVSHGQEGGITAQTHNDNSVTSHDQSGGITAQNVTVGTIIVNYFNNQSSDEKEALRQSLKTKYPLGYAVFAADGKDIHVPTGLSYERDFAIRWADAKVRELTPKKVSFQYPDIIAKIGPPIVLMGITGIIERKVGTIQSAEAPRVTMVLELLKDEGDFVVLALGFRENR